LREYKYFLDKFHCLDDDLKNFQNDGDL